MRTLRRLPLLLVILGMVPCLAADAPGDAELPAQEAQPAPDDAELGEEQIDELIAQLGSEEPSQRAAAAEKLGIAGVERAIPSLVPMLDDPDEDAQWKATVALGTMGEPAVPKLIEALSHPQERARWKAESALKMMGEEAVPRLIEALQDRRARIRQSAAYLLGQIKDPRALQGLAAALSDKDEDTRWKAADSLARFGEDATPAVLKQLRVESVEARRCAAWVFQQTADPEAMPALVNALNDADEQVRWKAAIALQKIGLPAAGPLLALLRSEAKEEQKNLATWVLEGIKDVKVQTALRDLKGALSRGGEEGTQRPRPEKLPDSVALQVTSEPPKATVFIDDKYAGVTPLDVKGLPPGHHFIKLTKRDHLPWTKLCELLYAEEKINAKLTLKPKGTLVVTSEPANADVYIDGEYEGKTPLEKKHLDANPYSVRVEKERFLAWESEVELGAGDTKKVHAPLKSKVAGWYLARLKDEPNDVSCHTELAHYYLVSGELDKAARSIARAVEVAGKGADTSGYTGRLAQEVEKMWEGQFQFGGDLEVQQVRRALHTAIHGVWKKNKGQDRLRRFLGRLGKDVKTDFTKPPR
ncbi:MAG: HEAT repeat domain-containing protein [Candidatus Brocadiia bacterium]